MTQFQALRLILFKRHISKWLAGLHVKKLMRERM